MITTVLAIFTLAAALGEEPAKVVGSFNTYDQCQVAKRMFLQEHWEEMQKNQTFPMCVDADTTLTKDMK